MQHLNIFGLSLPVHTIDTVVIGSGCAGFNAADWLYDLGRRDIAILTEGLQMGTSRNTGSDKQTYYKLSLCSDGADSVREMAQTLFDGDGVNGDIALTEAAGSVKSFIKLANLGVPFPQNEYGEYVGYKTDHDPRQRATSAGPLTSRYMTEALEKSVRQKQIRIFDGMVAVQLIVHQGKICGILALDTARVEEEHAGFTLFHVSNVILATGGPAGLYWSSVYPESQTGMSGMALEAGAQAANLQEWQYGLASTAFRWNVSGTYQQVLPRYIAVDSEGNEREFLTEYFDKPCQALDMVFLKGYQWPFDIRKMRASSLIDLIVHYEITQNGNRIFMDFRRDPSGLENGFNALGKETYNYLNNSNALLKTPIVRLEKMNPQAIELYRSHGIDLYTQPLEVAVCAQHLNGGIAVDNHWQSTVNGLYVVGEAAGTFGVYRPGGSALNSTQVGSMRAAEHIACNKEEGVSDSENFALLVEKYSGNLIQNALNAVKVNGNFNVIEQRENMQKAMSASASHIRVLRDMKALYDHTLCQIRHFFDNVQLSRAQDLEHLLKNRDLFITQAAVLNAMIFAAQKAGSRGSAMVVDNDGIPIEQLPIYRYLLPTDGLSAQRVITEISPNGDMHSFSKPVSPIPKGDDWFENVWSNYRKRTARLHH